MPKRNKIVHNNNNEKPINKVVIISQKRDFLVEKMFTLNGWEILERDSVETPHLVCFTGGDDLNPTMYKEKPLPCTNFDDERDLFDLQAWEDYVDVPKVGICRGGQFLNVMCGGSLWQDVNNHGGSHDCMNLLQIEEVPHIELRVTSTHHQMMDAGINGEVIAISNVASKFRSGNPHKKSPRFDTEVVWYEKNKCLCYQPHPEYKSLYPQHTEYFFDLINYLILERTNSPI